MGNIGDQTLHEDEYYVVLQNDDREIITLDAAIPPDRGWVKFFLSNFSMISVILYET